MKRYIGWALLLSVIPYTVYACFHPEHVMGVTALAISGGLFLRRARDERMKKVMLAAVREPAAAVDVAIPAPPSLPKLDPIEVDAAAAEDVMAVGARSIPPPLPPMPEFAPRTERRDEIRPPPLKGRPALKLVHSDGKRADVRDFRHRIAK